MLELELEHLHLLLIKIHMTLYVYGEAGAMEAFPLETESDTPGPSGCFHKAHNKH